MWERFWVFLRLISFLVLNPSVRLMYLAPVKHESQWTFNLLPYAVLPTWVPSLSPATLTLLPGPPDRSWQGRWKYANRLYVQRLLILFSPCSLM